MPVVGLVGREVEWAAEGEVRDVEHHRREDQPERDSLASTIGEARPAAGGLSVPAGRRAAGGFRLGTIVGTAPGVTGAT